MWWVDGQKGGEARGELRTFQVRSGREKSWQVGIDLECVGCGRDWYSSLERHTENGGSASGWNPSRSEGTELWVPFQRSCAVIRSLRNVGNCGCYQTSDSLKVVWSLERTQLEMSSFPGIWNYDFASFSLPSLSRISLTKTHCVSHVSEIKFITSFMVLEELQNDGGGVVLVEYWYIREQRHKSRVCTSTRDIENQRWEESHRSNSIKAQWGVSKSVKDREVRDAKGLESFAHFHTIVLSDSG